MEITCVLPTSFKIKTCSNGTGVFNPNSIKDIFLKKILCCCQFADRKPCFIPTHEGSITSQKHTAGTEFHQVTLNTTGDCSFVLIIHLRKIFTLKDLLYTFSLIQLNEWLGSEGQVPMKKMQKLVKECIYFLPQEFLICQAQLGKIL